MLIYLSASTIQRPGAATPANTAVLESSPSVAAAATIREASFSAFAKSETALVKKVIDGDTIELSDGRKVRYIGIDTPETIDPRRAVGCFGKQASAKNSGLVLGKVVILANDVSETDKFGRLLRYVWVSDVFVNEYLVREGFARASSYPPDIKFQQLFISAEQEARLAEKGLWGETCTDSIQKP